VYGSQKHVAEDKTFNAVFDALENVSVVVFTLDYVLRLYVAGCHEEYVGLGRWNYVTRFYSLVDLAAIAPFYITLLTSLPDINTSFIGALRLLRVLKAESYFKSGGFFTIVDDIVYDNKDVLSVTGFCAMVLWIFFSSIMYLLEKDNPLMATPDGDHYYKSIPHAMWPTLLNLSGTNSQNQ
jgi:voltage-gated potassium channel